MASFGTSYPPLSVYQKSLEQTADSDRHDESALLSPHSLQTSHPVTNFLVSDDDDVSK